jgi:hypothetical protein
MTIYRIVTGDARGVRGVYELEADTYVIEDNGVLKLFTPGFIVEEEGKQNLTPPKLIVAHAPGTWRSIVNATLFEGAVKRSVGTLDENSRGRLPARPIQAV